ncbi:MAG: calcium/sodium antiporter [Oscillospiraceae bacterium]
MTIIYFLFGLLLVIIGGDAFVDSSVRIAKRMHVSEMLIGATLVSIGTTLPELIVSATASVHGYSDVAAGNAIGSVICNTALIAGFVVAFSRFAPDIASFCRSYAQFFLAAGLYCAFACFGGLSRIAGIGLLLALFLYLFGIYGATKGGSKIHTSEKLEGSLLLDVPQITLGAALLFIGANLLVDKGTFLARQIGIPDHVISISMISLGTSLPELFTAVSAIRKKHGALSIGNIVGANILNLLMVSGVSSVIEPFTPLLSMLRVDIPVMLFVSLLLALPVILGNKFYRWQGFVLLISYATYITHLYIG